MQEPPLGVSSTFSVTDTSTAPARSIAATTNTSSMRDRATRRYVSEASMDELNQPRETPPSQPELEG